jgi:putative transposase
MAFMRPHGSAKVLEERRRQAVALRRRGVMPVEIAHRLHATRRSVRRWLHAYNCEGPAALAGKPSPGRPSHLTPRQRQGLVKCLLKGAGHYGFATDPWTSPRIARLIARRYGATYHVDAIPRLMAGLGFSPSKAAVPGQGAG